jgi:hypothetical protein
MFLGLDLMHIRKEEGEKGCEKEGEKGCDEEGDEDILKGMETGEKK